MLIFYFLFTSTVLTSCFELWHWNLIFFQMIKFKFINKDLITIDKRRTENFSIIELTIKMCYPDCCSSMWFGRWKKFLIKRIFNLVERKINECIMVHNERKTEIKTRKPTIQLGREQSFISLLLGEDHLATNYTI